MGYISSMTSFTEHFRAGEGKAAVAVWGQGKFPSPHIGTSKIQA